MDKYEYNLKLDQMKSLVAEGDYQAAAEIADTINWRKIKNVTALVRAGEIYEHVERFEESRDILLMAYDRSPIGRTIIYRLACVAIKMGNYDEAKEYYKEFVEIAPHDNLKYVLKYEINKAQKSDYKVLIANLEDLKEQEFTEEWGLELAHLYHQAGMGEKCIEACDELILYFGQGPYVERALELKMLYQPLTRQQEEKYRQFRQQKEGITEVRPEDALVSGEIVNKPVQIPEVQMSPERFNTQNLQEALQESMQKIMEATEKETVDDHMDNIKKLVEEIPYLQIPAEKEAAEEEFYIAAEKEIHNTLRLNFQEFLNEEYDGQMRILVPDRGVYEPQVRGQMTIEEVLAEWEKTRRAAEAALQEADQKKLETAKARALQEAGDIMERLVDVIPKLDSGFMPQDLLKEQYLLGEEAEEDHAAQMVANMNQLLQREIDRLSTENAQIEEQLAVEQEIAATQELAAGMQEIMAEEELPVIEDISMELLPVEEALSEEAGMQEKAVAESGSKVSGMAELLEDAEIAALLKEEGIIDEIPQQESVDEEASEEEFLAEVALELAAMAQEIEAEAAETEDVVAEPVKEVVVEEQSEVPMAPAAIFATRDLPQIDLPSDINLDVSISKFSEEQKELFSYLTPIRGMEDQICEALSGVASRLANGGNRGVGNLIVQGGSGTGKTVFATNFIKALQQMTGKPNGNVGKVDAATLNKKDVSTLFAKVSGGCLIIEGVGELSRETEEKLARLLTDDTQGTLVIIEDTKSGLEKALARDKEFASKFTERVSIPIFTNDELVVFAKAYAKENGYRIDEMGVLALYNSISNIEKLEKATTIAEVKEIIDDAIEHAETGTFRKAFSILTSTRFDDEDYVILHEKDFNI